MGKKKKNCYSGIGGQAVMEGIMMRNKDRYSVAVRKPDQTIELMVADYKAGDSIWRKIPFVRGVFSFVDSLTLGMKTLNYSAEFYGEGEEEETGFDRFLTKIFGNNAEKVVTSVTMIIAIIIAIAVFMVLPWFVASLLERFISNASLIAIIEGVLRLVIFILYILAISLMKDIRRVFMYHGAEHKCINCIERGKPLTVGNVKRSSRLHRRCGTSFLLIVMVISIILFFFIRVDHTVLRLVLRIALIPVIAGISYEVLRIAGKFDNWLIKLISAPGIGLQLLTTKEPEDDMIEVAIKAVEAVFDVNGYLKEHFPDEVISVTDGEDFIKTENVTSVAVTQPEAVIEPVAAPVEIREEVIGETVEEVVEEAAEEVAEEVIEEAVEEVAEEVIEEVAEEVAEEVIEEVTEEVAEEVIEEVTEEVEEEVIEEVTEEVAEEVIEEVTEEVAEEVIEEVTEEVTEEVIEETTEEVVEEEIEETTEAIAEEVVAESVTEEVIEEATEEAVEEVAEENKKPETTVEKIMRRVQEISEAEDDWLDDDDDDEETDAIIDSLFGLDRTNTQRIVIPQEIKEEAEHIMHNADEVVGITPKEVIPAAPEVLQEDEDWFKPVSHKDEV